MKTKQLCIDDIAGRYFYLEESLLEMAILSMYSIIEDYGFASVNKWLSLLNVGTVKDGDAYGWNDKNATFDVVYSTDTLPNGKTVLRIIHKNNPPVRNYIQ